MKTFTSPNDSIRLKLQPLAVEDGAIVRAKFMLVYQGCIANLFRVSCFNLSDFGRDAQRVFQGDFRTAEMMAHGAGLAGAVVMTSACNQAGDIRCAQWSEDLDSQPFSENFRPVFYTVGL